MRDLRARRAATGQRYIVELVSKEVVAYVEDDSLAYILAAAPRMAKILRKLNSKMPIFSPTYHTPKETVEVKILWRDVVDIFKAVEALEGHVEN